MFLGTLRWLRFDAWLVAILTGGVALYVSYLTYTDLSERNYDGPEHLWYVNFVAEHARLPLPSSCTVCPHPPLYYVLSALGVRLIKATHLTTVESGLQCLSLVIFLGFVVFGVLTIRCITIDPLAQRLGAALIVFWPTTVINSIRVHDDVLVATLVAGSLYFIVRWQKHDCAKNLYWAATLSGLGALTKPSTYAMILVLLVAVSWRFYKDRFTLARAKQVGFTILITVLPILISASTRETLRASSLCQRVFGRVCDASREHFVGNRWVNYLYFDMRFFLKQPFLINDPYDNSRDYFLNNFLKTSLFNAVPLGPEFSDRISAALASVLSYLTLGLLVYSLIGLFGVRAQQLRRQWVLLVASLLLLLQLFALRAWVPLSMHADFRYVFPLVIPAGVYFSWLIERYRRESRALFIVGNVLCLSLVTTSVVFFWPNHDRIKGPSEPTVERVNCPMSGIANNPSTDAPSFQAGSQKFGPKQLLELNLPQKTRVSRIDVSLDANDQYEILILSREMTRRLLVGPTVSWHSDLAHYQRDLSPPLGNVHTVTIRALSGDGYYALGQFVINPVESNAP
jgi:4-amino-4-deoxy-L-arabinose transferase-like glycosyltransferase